MTGLCLDLGGNNPFPDYFNVGVEKGRGEIKILTKTFSNLGNFHRVLEIRILLSWFRNVSMIINSNRSNNLHLPS